MNRAAFDEQPSLAEPLAETPAKSCECRSSWMTPLCIALVSRLGLWILAYLALATLEAGRPGTIGVPGNLFIAGWIRWDAPLYAQIAQSGYGGPEDNNYAFFPMYPLLVRALTHVVQDVYIAGLVVSNFAFVIAMVLLYSLIRTDPAFNAPTSDSSAGAPMPPSNEPLARKTLILLCLFPFAYVYSAMYTESLFLLLSIAVFYCARRGWWITAGCFACAAGATRMVGIAASITLGLMAWQQRGQIARSVRLRQILAVVISFVGFTWFILFAAVRRHDLLAVVHAQNAPGWAEVHTWSNFVAALRWWRDATFNDIAAGHVPLVNTINMFYIPVALLLCAIGWRKLPAPYALWTTIVLLASLTRWVGYGRYTATAFPLFIVAGMLLTDRRVYHGLVYLSTLLLAWLTILFVEQTWVA